MDTARVVKSELEKLHTLFRVNILSLNVNKTNFISCFQIKNNLDQLSSVTE